MQNLKVGYPVHLVSGVRAHLTKLHFDAGDASAGGAVAGGIRALDACCYRASLRPRAKVLEAQPGQRAARAANKHCAAASGHAAGEERVGGGDSLVGQGGFRCRKLNSFQHLLGCTSVAYNSCAAAGCLFLDIAIVRFFRSRCALWYGRVELDNKNLASDPLLPNLGVEIG